MRSVTSLAPSAAAPPPPGRGAPEEPAAPFAAILDNHQARTAVAEGHTPEKRSTGASDEAPCAPAATPEGGEAADAAVAQAAVAVVPPPVAPATLGAFVLQAPAQGAAEGEVPAGAGAPVANPLPGPAASVLAGLFAGDAPMPVVPGATLAGGAVPAGLAIPADLATASADVPVADLTLPAAPPAPPVAAETAPAGVPADRGAEAGPQADAGTGGDPRDLAGRTPQPATAAADASKPAAAPAAPAAPSAASAPSAPAPVSAPVSPVVVAAPAASSVPLHQAVETVRLTMHAASDRGISRARIALRPEELGGVEIHLRQTAEGLSARVVAEGPEAAQLLQQAAGDLRRSLEQQGLNLVNLEVSTTADDAAGGTGAGATGEERRQGARTGHGGSAETTEHEIALAPSTIELANGTLVDVLA